MKTDDLIYLEWLHNRLIDVYGENRNTDFVITLRRIINETEQKAVASAPKQPRANNKALRLFGVSRWAYLYDNASPLMVGFIAAMLLNTTYQLIESIILKIAIIIHGG